MSHPEPPVTEWNDASIRQRVQSEYTASDVAAVMAELARFAGDSEAGRTRIQHAALTLAQCDLKKLRHFIDRAIMDFRDVIFWAYSPEEAMVTPEEAKALLDRLRRAGMNDAPKLPGVDQR